MSATVIKEPVMVSPQDSSSSKSKSKSSPPSSTAAKPPTANSSSSLSLSSTKDQTASLSSSSNSTTTTTTTTCTTPQQAGASSAVEVESATCDCCGLTEDCTPEYISRIRERYAGRWICGLCSEAVKEEIVRSADKEERLISPEEAVARCRKVRLAAKAEMEEDPTAHLIEALRHMLRRSLDGVGTRSTPASPMRGEDPDLGSSVKNMMPGLARSESCFPKLAG